MFRVLGACRFCAPQACHLFCSWVSAGQCRIRHHRNAGGGCILRARQRNRQAIIMSRKTSSKIGTRFWCSLRKGQGIMSCARSRFSRFGFATEFFGGVDGVVVLPERVVTMTDV